MQLSHEHGVTYSAANPALGAFALQDAVAAVFKDAQVEGAQMLIRSQMSYEAAARASNDKKAFVKATSLMVKNMVNSMAKRLEISNLYGRTNLAKIDAFNGLSATTAELDIAAAHWASGIWAGSEGMRLDCIDTATHSGASTLLNGSDAVIITAVDLSARQLTVSSSNAALNGIQAAVAAGAYLIPRGSLNNDVFGLDRIVSNTGSLYNIDASQYALWKGNVVDNSGVALSFAKILNALARAVERGLDEDVVCMLSPKTWANISTDQAALRRYDDSYKGAKLENGAVEYSFFGQNGRIDIVSSIYAKEGECFIFPPKLLKRIGAMDISFKMPGRPQEEFFLELTSNAGYELRAYTDQTLFAEAPAKLVKIENIVNS